MANWFKAAESFLNKVDQAAVKLKDRGLGSDSEYSESDRESVREKKSQQLDHGFASSSSVISSNELPTVPRTPTTSKGLLATRQSRSSPSQQPRNQRPKESLSPSTTRKFSSVSESSTPYDSETGGNEDWTQLLASTDAGTRKGQTAAPAPRTSGTIGKNAPDPSKRETAPVSGKSTRTPTAASPSTQLQASKVVTAKAVSSAAGKSQSSSSTAVSSPRHAASPGGVRSSRPGGAMSMRGALDSPRAVVPASPEVASPPKPVPAAIPEGSSKTTPTTGSKDFSTPIGGMASTAPLVDPTASQANPPLQAGSVPVPLAAAGKAMECGGVEVEKREAMEGNQPKEEFEGGANAGEQQPSVQAGGSSVSAMAADRLTPRGEGQIRTPSPPASASLGVQEDLLDVYLSRMLVGQVAADNAPEGSKGGGGGGDGEAISQQGVDVGARGVVPRGDVDDTSERETRGDAGVVAQPGPLSASRSSDGSRSTLALAEEIKRKVLAADELAAKSADENGGKRRAGRAGKAVIGDNSDSDSDSGSDTSSDESDGNSALQRARADREAREKAAAIATAVSRENAAVEAARTAMAEREAVLEALAAEKEALQREAVEASTQHAQEIARLRGTMTEGMQAVQVEKHAHSSTRMDAHDREAILETENMEQAKALAAAQRALDEEVSRVMAARTGMGKCEAARAAMQLELATLRKQLERPQLSRDMALETARALMSEGASIAEELSNVATKIQKKQEEVREVEERLGLAKATRRQPSVLERELEGQLSQLTDHLIQKQSQVEALQSDKATLSLRLETSTASLQEEKATAASSRRTAKIRAAMASSAGQGWGDEDLEFGGASQAYYASGKGRSGRRYYVQDDFPQGGLSSVFGRGARALDSYVLSATRFLRLHGSVRAIVLIYLLALHGWVVVVFLLHSKSAENA